MSNNIIFDFKIKSPPASFFIKVAAKLKSGSKEPGRNIVASISKKQLESDMKQYSILSNRTDLSFSESLIAQMERAPEMLDLLNQQIKEITDKRNETLKSERDVRKLLSEKEERQRELSTQMTGFRSVPTLGTNPFGR